MSANRFISPFSQPFSATTGAVGAGWKLNFYLASAPSTREDTFADADLTVPNSNPVVADAEGRFSNIFLSAVEYAVVLTDDKDEVQATATPYSTAPFKAVDIKYTASAMGAVERALNERLSDAASLRDFGAKGTGFDVDDDAPALAAALAQSKTIYAPNGAYWIGSQVTRSAGNLTLIGESKRGVVFDYRAKDASAMLLVRNAGNIVTDTFLHKFSITGADKATGGGIELEDTSQCFIGDVFIEDFSADPTTNFGVKFRGRELIYVDRFTVKDVTKPLLFLDNPNHTTLDTDVVHLSDLYLNVSDRVNGVGIDFQGSSNTSITLSGQNSIAVTFHGIRVENTSSDDSLDLKISNLRIEQGDTAFARGVYTLTGQPLNNETITIGSKVYTFQTVLTNVDGNVLIGADASESLDNWAAAMNLSAGAGSTYAAATTAHPDQITALALDGDVVGVGGGDVGPISTSTTVTAGSWNQTPLKEPEETGFGVFVNQPATSDFQNIILDNIRVTHDNNGFFLRNANRVSIRNCSVTGNYGHYTLDVDGSIKGMITEFFERSALGFERNTGLSNLKFGADNNAIEIWDSVGSLGVPISSPQGINLQSSLNLRGVRTVATPTLLDHLTSNTVEVIANNGTAVTLPFPADVAGFGTALAIDDVTGLLAHGQFFFDGLGNVTIQTGNVSVTSTSGTPASLNIYQVANQIRIENKLGANAKIIIDGKYFSDALV